MLNKKKSKFDEQVKQSLGNYKARGTSNWKRMESMLKANAKTNRPIWLSVSLGVLAIAGAYFIYENVTSDNKMDAKSSSTNKSVSMPVITKSENIKPADVKHEISPTSISTEAKATPAKVLTKEEFHARTAKVDKQINELIRKENSSTKVTEVKETKVTKKQNVSVMGNSPVFPDMLDDKNGLVHDTKESKETQDKALKTSSVIPTIKWTYFTNKEGKLDSIRKTE
jgi:hypothetical protein